MPETMDKNRFVFFKYVPSKNYSLEEKKIFPIVSEKKAELDEGEDQVELSTDVSLEEEQDLMDQENLELGTKPDPDSEVELGPDTATPEPELILVEEAPTQEDFEYNAADGEEVEAQVHIIRPGDTFWKLAKEYGTTVEGIISANPDSDPLNLQVGEVLYIAVR